MDANATVTRAIANIAPNTYVTVDTIRDALDAAQLSSPERSGGLRTACADGYLRPVYHLLPGFSLEPVHVAVPSTHPAAKGRHILVWRRTAKQVPA